MKAEKKNAKAIGKPAKSSTTSNKEAPVAKNKKEEKAKAKPKAEDTKVEEKPAEEPKATEPVKFESLCGCDYDPSKSSSCQKICSKENPDSHAACVEHFKQNGPKGKETAKRKSGGSGVKQENRPAGNGNKPNGLYAIRGGALTINKCLKVGTTKEEFIKKVRPDIRGDDTSDAKVWARILGHFNNIKDNGGVVEVVEGKYTCAQVVLPTGVTA